MPWALGFSPDGRWLSALAGGELRIWRMRIEEQLQLACDLVGRNLSFDAWETFLAGIPYRLSCPGLGLHPDFITAAERLASQGEVDRAAERFRVAKAIDSTLAIEPRARAVELAVRGHLEQGRSLARKGRLDAALAELRNVGRLDPNSDFDPQAEVNRFSEAWNLREKAIALAGSGKVDEGVEVFKQALALDPSLDLDPVVEARRLNAPRIQKEGDRLARAGQLDAAAAMYARALEDGLESGLDPASEAKRVRASALIDEARDIARRGELAQAQETFQRALALNPLLRLDPVTEARKFFAKHRLEQGEEFHRQGQLAESVSAYREAVELDPDTRISAFVLNDICWNGVKQDLAGEVLWACNQAVAREPENGSFHDSRGVARVLTGDIAGAIEDFEAFIDLGSEYDRSAEAIAVRQRWIAGLRTGQRPSTFAGLESLGNPR
jgi:tetratricopeptide (TPR) repeat protein